jgi:predicted Zn-dependent peptidase
VRSLRELSRRFAEPEVRSALLPGGILVLAEEVAEVPSLALGAWVRVGSRDEDPEQAGVTHFIEHLVFKGSRRHNGYELAKRMEAIGGQVDAYTTKESTCFYARVFAGYRRRAVEMLAEVLCEPAFDAEDVRREVGVVAEEIQGYEDSPEELIHDLAAEELFHRHPLGTPILGRRETLARLGVRSVRRFYRDRYTAPEVVVAAAGRFDFDLLVEDVARTFRLPRRRTPVTVPRMPRFRARERHEEKDLAQASLCLLRRGPSYRDRDRHAIFVLNTILGSGASSRLYQSIREDEGLAYSVYSFLDSFRDTGAFGVYLGVGADRLGEALRLVCRELRRIRERGVHVWELESARAQIFTGLFLSYESMYERVARLAHNELYYGGQVPLAEVVGAVERITLEDVHRVARELLDPSRFCLVTLAPAGTKRPGLAALDF